MRRVVVTVIVGLIIVNAFLLVGFGSTFNSSLFALFEEGFEEWEGGKPVGWDAAGDVTRSSQIVFEGDFSARVQRRAEVSGYSAGMLMREVEIPADDLMFSFAYYAENIGESTDYVLGLYFSDGSWLVYTFNERENMPNVHYVQIPKVEGEWATYSRNIEQDLLSSYGDSNKVLKKIIILVVDEKTVLYMDQLRFYPTDAVRFDRAMRLFATNLVRMVGSMLTSFAKVINSMFVTFLTTLARLLAPLVDLIPFILLACFLLCLMFSLSWLPIGLGISLIGLAGIMLGVDASSSLADDLAVNAYYFLVIGVALRVVEYVRKSDKSLASYAMVKFRRIVVNHRISLPNTAPCPKCGAGNLLPFLRASFEKEGKFSHYEIYYRCSNPDCLYQIDG